MPVIQVALPIPLCRIFEYLTPIGVAPLERVRVRVPFGQRKMIGIITKCNVHSELNFNHLKSIYQILDYESIFSPPMWHMLSWAADYYHYPIGKILFHALPNILRAGKSIKNKHKWQWMITEQGKKISLEALKRTPQQQYALATLLKHPLDRNQVTKYKLTEKILHKIKTKGLVELLCVSTESYNWRSYDIIKNKPPKILSNEQIFAIKNIKDKEKQFNVWLLTGSPGSGKKEVYFHVIEKILIKGYQALVLVPKISLISQTVAKFKERFNVPIYALHSRLNNNNRLEIWLKARNGNTAIVIGTRSALFTPFANLGIIIIDQEHNISYKQRTGWLYHARNLAVFRAYQEGIPIILNSSSPSLETLHNVALGKYRHVQLTKKLDNTVPTIKYLIDLKNMPIKSGLTQSLLKRIKLHINAGNQVILFLDSRNFFTILFCYSCNYIFKCKDCSYHYALNYQRYCLYCYYCSDQKPIPKQCPQCSSYKLSPVNFAAEQLKNQLTLIFPKTNIIHMNNNYIGRNNILERNPIEAYRNDNAHILISTDFLAEVQNVNNITLIAILNIDGMIFSADFHALERFAQIYTHITGLVENGERQSEIILQTHYPKHPLILTLLHKGYNAFAKQVLKERKEVCLPPYIKHIIVRANDDDDARVLRFLKNIKYFLENIQFRDELFFILGPIPSIPFKDGRKFRWQLILQHHSRIYLHKIVKNILIYIGKLPEVKYVKWAIDVDPTEN
ncbi:primosomal protein N' [Candidatus Profftia sp. (ex Adelges kitamiensis)]|uniref:primosomal protein N' n=1 Tax=Candidatus Profftia sp. (ex Adelges kitamiensis) TaxID=2864218 RepID=UPI001CE353D5|nr:primosomal protein N' [Candidatus Profftia sp. (ex Adelges kitamiensis)]